ncbi:MAG: response regulator transcription factor [Bacteroidales bacterium]|nr:response regulator transcription factor [Bacteroidales bacterium]
MDLYIVDDHKMFREGMKLLLSMQGFVDKVHEASSGEEFLGNLSIVESDVVLMDIEMSGMNGIEAVAQAVQKNPDIKIIALTMYGDDQYFNKMLDAGAKGFVLKSAGIEQLSEAIQCVANGDYFFSEELLDSWNRRLNGNKIDKDAEHTVTSDDELSVRELDILYYVCQGFSNQEIADQLFISKRTVDKHRANLLLKTGCRNTAALVKYAIQNKLIPID